MALPEGASAGLARLYEDGRFPTPDGKARFADTPYQKVAEPRDARFPFSLNTGRLRDQWHGMSRTGTIGRLFGHVPEPVIEMHEQDMARQKLVTGDLVTVTSRRGALVLRVQASAQGLPAQAFIAMHWGAEYLSGCSATGERLAGVNALTSPAFCPQSKQPELSQDRKGLAALALAGRCMAAGRQRAARPAGTASLDGCVPVCELRTLRTRAQWCTVPRRRPRARRRGAAGAHRSPARPGRQPEQPASLRDKRRGQRRSMRLMKAGDDTRLDGFLLAGDISAEAWVKALLQDELPAQAYGRLLLVPGAKPPVALALRGRQVCSCLNVSETQIEATLAGCSGPPDLQLEQLQNALKCGTNCGSCVPELKRLVRLQPQSA